jgi:hypothetical protein
VGNILRSKLIHWSSSGGVVLARYELFDNTGFEPRNVMKNKTSGMFCIKKRLAEH